MKCDRCLDLRDAVRQFDHEAAVLDGRAAGFRRMAAERRGELAEHGRAHAYGLPDGAALGSWEMEAANRRAREVAA